MTMPSLWPAVRQDTLAWAAAKQLQIVDLDGERLRIDIEDAQRSDCILVFLVPGQRKIAVDVVTGGYGCAASYTGPQTELSRLLDQALTYSETYGG